MPRINQDLSGVTQEDMDRTGGWQALEPGDYRMVVTKSDYKSTRNGDGKVLWLYVNCIDHSARWTEFLTIEHSNPTTVKIARAKLKQLAIAVGHRNPDRVEYSEDLHDRPFVAAVIQEEANDPKYGDVNGMTNRIQSYHPLSQQAPPPATGRGAHTVERPSAPREPLQEEPAWMQEEPPF